jgi:high-affinity nickel-transport protein
MIDAVASSAFVAALLFGFRHGFDWDHLAALSDLTGSQRSARRSMHLATLYAVGHACMVIVLGAVAIVFAEKVPVGVDLAMEKVVGLTLVALGLWIAWTAVRTRAAPPLRSRWMLVIAGVRRLVGPGRAAEPVVIEHSHPHVHDDPMHGHTHEDLAVATVEPAATPVVVAHSHTHRHLALPVADPFVSYGTWSAFGVGVLHGVGAETPTQVLVFAAAANAGSREASLGLLLCFVVGLVFANTLIAAATTLGFAGALRRREVAMALATVTAIFSLALGARLLAGRGDALPAIFGG